jgi:hypothetical protein
MTVRVTSQACGWSGSSWERIVSLGRSRPELDSNRPDSPVEEAGKLWEEELLEAGPHLLSGVVLHLCTDQTTERDESSSSSGNGFLASCNFVRRFFRDFASLFCLFDLLITFLILAEREQDSRNSVNGGWNDGAGRVWRMARSRCDILTAASSSQSNERRKRKNLLSNKTNG